MDIELQIEDRRLPISERTGAGGFLIGNRGLAAANGFTLIELVLVMALLVVAVSIVAPRMSGFIRGQAIGSEARRLEALMHAGQARAVSEGMPMVLWFDAKQNECGLQEETPPRGGDPRAESVDVSEYVQIAVANAAGPSGATTFHNLPAIRFLPDGMVDENSPQTLELTEGNDALWFIEMQNRTGYEVSDTKP
jgi:prepilin-type N-terminal cleavage/methylation domain-containing protein